MLESIQKYASNRIDASARGRRWFAGIIGDRPSQYAKSPSLWNRAFSALGIDAVFSPLDVEAQSLPAIVQALRETPAVVGFSVTAPYKEQVVALLDDLDPKARQIGAINTVARTPEGRLIGYNTDGQGFIDMLIRPLPGQKTPFLANLEGKRALLIGAGGAAKAVAVYLAEAVGRRGAMTIVNRDAKKAQELAASIASACPNAAGSAESGLGKLAASHDLIVNATTKGQAGIRRLPGGRATVLEAYNALAPANPAVLPEPEPSQEAAFYASWFKAAARGIEANHALAGEILAAVPTAADFVDLIYAPLETRMLAMARLSGHRTLNGKGMNISQAADAFVNRVMTRHLADLGLAADDAYARVYTAMSEVW